MERDSFAQAFSCAQGEPLPSDCRSLEPICKSLSGSSSGALSSHPKFCANLLRSWGQLLRGPGVESIPRHAVKPAKLPAHLHCSEVFRRQLLSNAEPQALNRSLQWETSALLGHSFSNTVQRLLPTPNLRSFWTLVQAMQVLSSAPQFSLQLAISTAWSKSWASSSATRSS